MANLSSLFGNTAFVPDQVEDVSIDFSPLPKGEYLIQITESEIAPNNKGTGANLTLKCVVQQGEYKNRVIFENLCVQHVNPTAQGIAQTRLKQICQAIGVAALKDSSQLHDKPLVVQLDVELDQYATDKRGDGEKVYRNQVKGYRAAKNQAPTQVAKPKPKPEPVSAGDDDFVDDIPF